MATRTQEKSIGDRVAAVLRWLERRGTKRNRDGMARYGISVGSGKIFGVSMATMQTLARQVGRDHQLAAALWECGWYEARILTSFVDDPAQVTSAQMDRWCRAFDNWAICDTLCLHLFDRTPHAWGKVDLWSRRQPEFVRRAGFVMLAALALHDKQSGDEKFLRAMPLIETTANDDRNFVKKAVNWALRAIGYRNLAPHAAALKVAERLAAAESPSARWVGKDAARQLTRPLVLRRLRGREPTAGHRGPSATA